ncbi:unnamed protein product [Echinostoma caproni]|uniref:AKAP7_NLS domain-containing protein n=1 Tax=Echinostoma caproni TaxID=27848 RepID=A0A183AUK5_9TREM|nr:unnamed protein product [Echinostoma caproni]
MKSKRIKVVYLDSFAGLLERPLSSFSWNFEANFGWCPFVVPGWQIVQLKYESHIVWSNLTDQSFEEVKKMCSAGTPEPTVEDLVDKTRTSVSEEETSSHTTTSELHFPITDDEQVDERLSDAGLETSNEMPVSRANKSVHPVTTKSSFSITSEVQQKDLSDVFWHRPNHPNFFVCQRVKSSSFNEKALQVKNYFEALKRACASAAHLVPQVPLQLVGVNTFDRRVLYVRFQPNSELQRFVNHLNRLLHASGFSNHNALWFTPHITLMKLNGKQYNRFKINSKIVEKYRDEDFGTLLLRELHLCLMGASRDELGFHRSYGSVAFNPVTDE